VFGEEIHLLEAFVHREPPGAVAYDHYVIGALHYGFGEAGDVFDAADAGYGAGAMGGAVHAAGIELDFALFVGEAAVAYGVIVGVVFDDCYGGYYGVQGVASFFEDVHASAECIYAVGAGDH
jgi:hypothetical protein